MKLEEMNLRGGMQQAWLEQMQRARQKFEDAMTRRRKCYSFAKVPGSVNVEYSPIVPDHLEKEIRWHKQWLDYGQRLGEAYLFTVAVNDFNHPRRF